MPERINVRVIPNAARNEVVGWTEGVLKIKLQAVPEDGKANKALCLLLAKRIGCHKREIKIVSGEKSRKKIVEVPHSSHSLSGLTDMSSESR